MLKKIKNKFISRFPYFFAMSYQKEKFFNVLGYYPSVKKPLTINEIIFNLKMSSPYSYSKYTDKILVRDYVSTIINRYNFTNLFIPEILVQSENVKGLTEKLPNCDCFIKANHGSGMCFLYQFNGNSRGLLNARLEEIGIWLKTDYSKHTHERCYKKIKRQLFCEEVLTCKDGSLPDDIKVHCYYGKPAVIQIIRRSSGVLERQTYDEQWRPQEWFQNEVLNINSNLIPKNEVLDYSAALSQKFPYVRVDFYLVDKKLYFSELTFYPMSATLPLKSYSIDLLLGEKYKEYCKDSKFNNEYCFYNT